MYLKTNLMSLILESFRTTKYICAIVFCTIVASNASGRPDAPNLPIRHCRIREVCACWGNPKPLISASVRSLTFGKLPQACSFRCAPLPTQPSLVVRTGAPPATRFPENAILFPRNSFKLCDRRLDLILKSRPSILSTVQ